MPASQLTSAHVNSADYSYAYDAIGNRTAATEAGTRTVYTANRLNQYTAEGSFRPTFDADGNQTLIKTSTGTWNVTYNAKNRPVRFEKADSSIVVECTYKAPEGPEGDWTMREAGLPRRGERPMGWARINTMGRRATKKVTTNGTLTEYRPFLYRGYLQIACCDLTRAYTPALWFITWESPRRLGGGLDKHEVFAPKGRAGNGVPASQPTQPTAPRPLAIQKNGTWYTYGWDLTKNICETYRTDARIDLAYTYTPYGEVSPAHSYDQPIRWSSEYHDVEFGLVYYNYRHYNPAMGRWMGRDLVLVEDYLFANNRPQFENDHLGLIVLPWGQNQSGQLTAPNVILVDSKEDEELCATCKSKLQGLKDYIIQTYKIINGNSCTIKLDCQNPATWPAPNMGAYFKQDTIKLNIFNKKSGLIGLTCGECNKEYKYSYQSGAYFLYGFSDKAKHEIQHAIDHCQGITGWTRRETRAYALHQMKQGSVPRDAYISILRKNIMQSFNITNLPFDESEFQATLTELDI